MRRRAPPRHGGDPPAAGEGPGMTERDAVRSRTRYLDRAAGHYTVPNVITAVRTIAVVVLAVHAIATPSAATTCAAFLTYWVGDILDGFAARRLRQETRAGAVADIVADRASAAL